MSLVTGAASGLGRATAERLAKNGGSVILCDLPSSAGESVAKEIGHGCIFAPVDVSVTCSVFSTFSTNTFAYPCNSLFQVEISVLNAWSQFHDMLVLV